MLLIDETAREPKSTIFASEDSERCVAGVYWDEYDGRALRCGLFLKHSGYHLSKAEESGGMSRLWINLDPGFTGNYLVRPAETRSLAKRESGARRWIANLFRFRRTQP